MIVLAVPAATAGTHHHDSGKTEMSDPLDKIRDAVLDSASAGADPAEVIVLLLKISGEIAITTQTMNRETYQELSEVLWKQSEVERYMRLVTPQEAADA